MDAAVFERNFFKRVPKKWSAKGRGHSLFLFFPFLPFFGSLFGGMGRFRFWYLCSPLPLFSHSSIQAIDSYTSKIGMRLIARKRISRDFELTVYVLLSFSLSNFYPAVISSSDRYVEPDIVGSTRINSKFALFLLLFLFPG